MSWLGLLVGFFSCCSVMYSHKMKSGLDSGVCIMGVFFINLAVQKRRPEYFLGNFLRLEKQSRQKELLLYWSVS